MAFCIAACPAHAEKNDSTQPTNVEAEKMDYDDIRQTNVFTGSVRLTRGTLIMKSQRMLVRQDPAGYQYGTLFAGPGAPATFRQKRDGGPNLWVEGEAQRIEYDGKSEVVKLFVKAKMRRLEGSKVTDDVAGEFISYDTRTEFYSVTNALPGQSQSGTKRIKVVIQPREDKKAKPKSGPDTEKNKGK